MEIHDARNKVKIDMNLRLINAQQVTGIRGPKVAFFLLPIRSKKCLEMDL
jgi:hypothetical protein